MAISTSGATSAFAKIDKQSVIGTLKATGSRDRDIIHTQMSEMLAGPKQLKMVGLICMVGGGVLTITVFAAFLGIPVVILGLWLWSFNKKKIATIEAAYGDYLATLGA
jgi:hypothetical protein